MVAFVLLARVLSPAGFGAYAVLTSGVFLAGQIGTLGLRQAAAYRIGRETMTDGKALGLLVTVWPFLSIACAVAVYLINKQALEDLGLSLGIAILASVAAVLFLNLIQGIFLGRGEIKAFALADAGPRVLQSALCAALWLAGMLTINTALWSFMAGFALLIPIVLWMAAKPAKGFGVDLGQAPGMVRYGLLFAVSMFLILLQGRIGVFFLSGAKGAVEAGQFFAAQRANEIFLELASAIGLVLFSETSRSKSPDESLRAALKTATGLFALFLVVGLAAASVAPFLVKVLLGPQYSEAASVLRILAIGLAPAAAVRVLNSVVAGVGRPYVSAGMVLAGIGLNAALCALLVPAYGADGAAVGLVAGQAGAALGYVVFCRIGFGIQFREFLPVINVASIKRLRFSDRSNIN